MFQTDIELKKLPYTFTYGVYIITTQSGDDKAGMTAVWVCQAGKEPIRIGIGITPDSHTAAIIHKSGRFVINVLNKTQTPIAYTFGSDKLTPMDKFNAVSLAFTSTGLPYLTDSDAWMECKVSDTLNLDSHLWIVGELVNGGIKKEIDPAVYRNGAIF